MSSRKINNTSIEHKSLDGYFIENFIVRAIKKECYIEVISLVHNTIELYLKSLIIQSITKKGLEYELKRKSISQVFSNNSRIDSLLALTEICFLFDLINEDIYKNVKSFNTKRNNIFHKILKVKTKKKSVDTYEDVKKTARLGREIQLRLSPLRHTEEDIKRVMNYFDNPSQIPEYD